MQRNVLTSYLIERRWGALLYVVLFLFLYFRMDDKSYLSFFLVPFVYDYVRGVLVYRKRQEYLAELAEEGLTEEEVDNSEFIREWQKTKNAGILRYCLINGGIYIGFWLFLVIGFIIILIDPSLFGAPVHKLQFIEFTCPVAALLGIFFALRLWSINEKKYARLIIASPENS